MDLPAVEKTLAAIAGWPENWNGYGCIPPTPGSIAYAYIWLRDVALPVCDGRIDTLTSGCWGEVFLEWWEGQKKLSISIDEEGVAGLCFHTALPRNHPWEFIDVPCNTREQFVRTWQWLLDAAQVELHEPEV